MNTKEAIKFLDELRHGADFKIGYFTDTLWQIIELLKRGEKYEAEKKK